MSKRTSWASFLRVNALRPDLVDLATVDVAEDELSELSSSPPPGLGDDPPPPPPPPPKLGEGLPFSFYISSAPNPIAEIQGRLVPQMVVRLRLA